MKRILIFTILLILIFTELYAQRGRGLIGRRKNSTGSIVLSAGPTYCAGDQYGFPNPNYLTNIFKNSLFSGNNADVSLGFRHKFPNDFGYKATFLYGKYAGEDDVKYHNDGSDRYSFNAQILQFTARAEYSKDFGRRYARSTPSNIYGFLGAGLINSAGTYLPTYIESNNNTPFDYKITTAIITGGIGYQYELLGKYYIGAEIGTHFAPLKNGDKIDGYDFNNTHKESANDFIVSISITFAYKIF